MLIPKLREPDLNPVVVASVLRAVGDLSQVTQANRLQEDTKLSVACVFIRNAYTIPPVIVTAWNKYFNHYKLDGVGPIDNIPSTDKIHNFVHKK